MAEATAAPGPILPSTRDVSFSIKEGAGIAYKHFRDGTINYPMLIFLTLAHVAGIYGIMTIPKCHNYTLLWAFILWPIRYLTNITLAQLLLVHIVLTVC